MSSGVIIDKTQSIKNQRETGVEPEDTKPQAKKIQKVINLSKNSAASPAASNLKKQQISGISDLSPEDIKSLPKSTREALKNVLNLLLNELNERGNNEDD